MEKLQVELVKMQEWVKVRGAKICVLFEGRDKAGKGGVIRRITERVSPRVFRVVALPAPSEREKSQMYFERYMPHLPAAGEVVIFDRGWYNWAGVERAISYSDIILIKYWLEVSMEVQDERLRARDEDPREPVKLPKRQAKGDYVEPDYPYQMVPDVY